MHKGIRRGVAAVAGCLAPSGLVGRAPPRFSIFFPGGNLHSARAVSRTALRFAGAGA